MASVSVSNLLYTLTNYETFYGKEKQCVACTLWMKECTAAAAATSICNCKSIICLKHAQTCQILLKKLHQHKLVLISSRDENFYTFRYSLALRYAHPITLYLNVCNGLSLTVKKNMCFLNSSNRIANVLIIWFIAAGRSQQQAMLLNASKTETSSSLPIWSILESTKFNRLILVNYHNYLRHMPQDTFKLDEFLKNTIKPKTIHK